MSDDAVKVAVRVRPFNAREIERGCKLCIRMSGNTTVITDEEGKDKNFTFDYSYWSFDKADETYATQEMVFKDLGYQVLHNAWDGYNCSIFAYGQTGSGKSYSMLGYGEEKGIIPLLCEALFEQVNEKKQSNPQFSYKVEVSFMEIYNERVKDLLNPKNKGTLKVRNNPTVGPYVEDLSKIAVSSFAEIDMLMDEGTKARTVASTNMNATSSRSHAVFIIEFQHAMKTEEKSKGSPDKSSKINLVDLAGSERATSTGNTGVRLKEGANINKSLSTLAKVISSLAMNSGASKKKIHVPYRDSVLTWLLKESLGGNAKTIMVAALSPADINYGETLSTLRYADNAKRIKNRAVVNEDATSKLIKDLKAEVEQLRKNLVSQVGGEYDPSITKDVVVSSLKEELQQREKLIAEMNKTWEEKLKEAETIKVERKTALEDMGVAIKAVASLPHLVNLNEDPLMSESLLYYLKDGTTKIGRSHAVNPQDIVLNGLSIAEEHCVIENKEGVVTIAPLGTSSVFINGELVTGPQKLTQGNRVVLGNNHIFRFNHPEEASKAAKEKEEKGEIAPAPQVIDWDFAIKELAATHYNIQSDSVLMSSIQKKSKDIMNTFIMPTFPRLKGEESKVVALAFRTWREKVNRSKLKKRISNMLILINEANAISQALNKNVSFELKLWSSFPTIMASNEDDLRQLEQTEAGVKLTNTNTKATSVWIYDTFVERMYEMRDLYQNFLESGASDFNEAGNPFDMSSEQLIGVAHMYLKNLCYLFEINRTVPILHSEGDPMGELQVEIVPSLDEVLPIATEPSVEGSQIDPQSLIGKKLKLSIRIIRAINLPTDSYSNIYCKYSFWGSTEPAETNRSDDLYFGHSQVISVGEVTKEFLSYLEKGALAVEIWGNAYQKEDTEEQPFIPQVYDLRASINIFEFERKKEETLVPIPMKEEHHPTHLDQKNAEPSSIFLIRKGHKRRIVLSILQMISKDATESDFGVEKCLFAKIGNIRLKNTHKNNAHESLGSSSPSVLPRSPFNAPPVKSLDDFVELSVEECGRTSIVVKWDPSDHNSPLLNEKTLKGYRVSLKMEFSVQFAHISQPVFISIPIHLKVVDAEYEFKESAALLAQYRNLLKAKPDEKELNGSLFSLKVNQANDFDQPATIVAIIDEHKENLALLGNALELEKLRQELEFQEKLSVSLRAQEDDSAKKEISEQIDTLKSEQEIAFKVRKRSSSLSSSSFRTVAVEVASNSFFHNVQMSGYLNKKSAIKNRWKKFWFILRRPYLLYYSSKKLEHEKAIELTNSALTEVQDEENPFSFAIVTWKRVWILQATGQEEKEAWISAIDPSMNAHELKRRVTFAQEQLEAKEEEIFMLNNKLSETDEKLREKVDTLQAFCASLTNKLEGLKQQLVKEQEEGKKKDENVSFLKGKLAATEDLAKRDATRMQQDIDDLRAALRGKEDNPQASVTEQLALKISEANQEISNKDQLLEVWEAANEKLKAKLKEQEDYIASLKNQLEEKEGEIKTLTQEVKASEAELIEKDYQVEMLSSNVKNAEDEVNSRRLALEQMNSQLKLKTEEVATKDDLIHDKFNIKLPLSEESSFAKKFFGSSRADTLEKQLILSKKASLAHQTHNAFLNMEITRVEKEMQAQSKLREQTIDRLKKEINLLRKRLFTVSKEKGERMAHTSPESQENVSERFHELKKNYFANYAVIVKMDLTSKGLSCNLNVNQMFEQAVAEGIDDFEDYPDWLTKKMNEAAVQDF